MANKASSLLERLSGNMEESLGKRTEQAVEPPTTLKMATDPTALDGFRRNKDAGKMAIENIIADPNQVRKEFNEDSLKGLGESIKTYGLLTPILVEWSDKEKKHVIIAGERRWRACKAIGLEEIDCFFRNDGVLSDEVRMAMQLIENCQREDLTPFEQAESFQAMMDRFGLNQAQAAEKLSLSKGLITKRLALLEVSDELKQKVKTGAISGAVAYEIHSKVPDKKKQGKLAQEVIDRKLNRDDAVSFIATKSPKKATKAKTAKAKAAGKEKAPRKRKTESTFKLKETGATVTLTWPKAKMTKADECDIVQELFQKIYATDVNLMQFKAIATSQAKSGKDAAVKD